MERTAVSHRLTWATIAVILEYFAFGLYEVFSANNKAVGIGVFIKILYAPLFWMIAIVSAALAFLLSKR